MTEPTPSYIRWFRDLSLADLPLVGGKNASLGEMFRELAPLGVRIPDGFAVTAQGYRDALDAAGAWGELHALLDGLDKRDTDALARAGARAREIVYAAPMPKAVEQQVREAWRTLKAQVGPDLSVAVRSSATAEDLPTASFAGQHDTYLNIRGEEMLRRRRQALPGVAVHRPRDQLPHRPGLRPLQGLPLGRGDADGAQ